MGYSMSMKKVNFSLLIMAMTSIQFGCVRDHNEKVDDFSLPQKFDLREQGYIPGIREQAWGTCWAFASMLSMESNLMMTKNWNKVETGNPHLSPYFLDKYSGFTQAGDDDHVKDSWHSGQGSRYPGSNSDDYSSGLIVHLGGDFTTATAFLTNTRGAVQQRLTPTIPRKGDHKLFGDLPTEGVLLENNYTYFFPKKIVWLSLFGTEKEIRKRIKESIMNHGAVSSSQKMEENALGFAKNGLPVHATLDKKSEIDHAINLIGWDDHFEWKNHRGAWIAQDSDHRNEKDEPQGHFYILYDDVHTAKDQWMGAVSFQDVVVAPFKQVYSHSLHGLRFSTNESLKVFSAANQFTAQRDHQIKGVGFYTLSENVSYKIEFKEKLQFDPIKVIEGKEMLPGFHFIDIDWSNHFWKKGENIIIQLTLSDAKYAYDASSEIKVLLGKPLPEWGQPMLVNSKANKNESFWLDSLNKWNDFSNYKSQDNGQQLIKHSMENDTANFAINLYVD